MVLLDLFRRLSKTWRLNLTVAHVNHGLRKEASDADELLVCRAAEKACLNFHVAKWKKPRCVNIQDAARRFRYDFFRRIASKINADCIATAHNQDDQAETVLMHLIRGSGIRGLSGMNLISGSPPKIIRPLLLFSRNEIENYANERKILFADDETNQKLIYTRNSVRHQVIPMLEKLNPRVKESLSDAAFILRDYESAVDAVAYEFTREYFRKGRQMVCWDRLYFLNLPTAIRRRVLIMAYEEIHGDRTDLNSDQIEHMDAVSAGNKPKGRYMLPGKAEFIRVKDILSIQKFSKKPHPLPHF